MTEAAVSRAAKLLANRGASKGGKARAAKLTDEERRAIARKAAQARWNKVREEDERSYAERDAADR